jgi:hypothetical protein
MPHLKNRAITPAGRTFVSTLRALLARSLSWRLSSPEEFHPEALPEPYLSLSTHTAPVVKSLTALSFPESQEGWLAVNDSQQPFPSSCPVTAQRRVFPSCPANQQLADIPLDGRAETAEALSLAPQIERVRSLPLPCCSSPFCRLPGLLVWKYNTALPCPSGSSHLWLARQTWPHYTYPFAPSVFTDFMATTRYSAPWCRFRTFALMVQSTWSFSVCIDTEGSHVPCNRLVQDQATSMPDTVPPVNRLRRNLSRSLLTNHGFDIVLALFDMNSR